MISARANSVILAVVLFFGITAMSARAGVDGTADATGSCPVEAFRKLLRMEPAALEVYLTNYPAANRDAIRQKVDEYRILPSPIGELRLAVTELRWYCFRC